MDMDFNKIIDTSNDVLPEGKYTPKHAKRKERANVIRLYWMLTLAFLAALSLGAILITR